MKIKRIEAFQTQLPYAGGAYHWGRGNVIRTPLSTVITVDTDEKINGCDECCPIGGTYLAAYPEGIVPALARLAPALIGEDPRAFHAIERRMDAVLQGHPYTKSAIDAACWDILGKSTGQPVYTLMGGKLIDGGPMYRVVPQKAPEEVTREMELHLAPFRKIESSHKNKNIKVVIDGWGTIVGSAFNSAHVTSYHTHKEFIDPELIR